MKRVHLPHPSISSTFFIVFFILYILLALLQTQVEPKLVHWCFFIAALPTRKIFSVCFWRPFLFCWADVPAHIAILRQIHIISTRIQLLCPGIYRTKLTLSSFASTSASKITFDFTPEGRTVIPCAAVNALIHIIIYTLLIRAILNVVFDADPMLQPPIETRLVLRQIAQVCTFRDGYGAFALERSLIQVMRVLILFIWSIFRERVHPIKYTPAATQILDRVRIAIVAAREATLARPRRMFVEVEHSGARIVPTITFHNEGRVSRRVLEFFLLLFEVEVFHFDAVEVG